MSFNKGRLVRFVPTYGNSQWKDQLTAFNGAAFTYDAIGNPTKYNNGKSYNFQWQKGRELYRSSVGGVVTYYAYGTDGLRTIKNTTSAGGDKFNYYYANGKLISQIWENGAKSISFLYDEAGSVYGFVYRTGDTTLPYYYIKNLQGDVIAIVNKYNQLAGSYTYDAWGNVLAVRNGSGQEIAADLSHIANFNPIRYRSYYYDTETGFYYLQTRYYDPATGRFVNADGVISGVGKSTKGYNMYEYCFNNPINMNDDAGSWPSWDDIKNGIKKAVKWLKEDSVDTVKKVVKDLKEDYNNYEKNNKSEDVVFRSNYFSSYNGVLVVKTPFKNSFSYGFIGLSTQQLNTPTIKHEYGHALQMDNMGVVKYTVDVAIPSITINTLDEQSKLPYDYYSYPWEAEANELGGSTLSQYWKPALPQGGYTSYRDLIPLFFEQGG